MSHEENCPRIEGLSALTDDALDETQRAALEAHVAGCAICAPMLARMRELHGQFAALPASDTAFDVAAEVDRRIGAMRPTAPRRAPPQRRRNWWPAAVLAPGGVLAFSVGLWLGVSMMPATIGAASTQMAAFSASPPGAICPLPKGCRSVPR